MGKVVANASMSLDGYIAKQDNTIGLLFDWLQNGDVEVISPRGDRTFLQALTLAGDRTVAVTAGVIAGQCLELGLLDEVAVDLVPVVMGGGRGFFGDVTPQDIALGDPTTCIQGERVVHLVLPVIT